jgi:hypothetical protein
MKLNITHINDLIFHMDITQYILSTPKFHFTHDIWEMP